MVLQAEAPPIRLDEDGVLRVGDTRLLVDLIVEAFRDGASPETIAEMYDTATLEQVYGVIAWYLRHQPEVDAYLLRREREAEAIQAKIQASQPDRADFRARIMARRAALQRQGE